MLDTSDLVLTLGIKFWAGLVEERNIKELEEAQNIVSQIKHLLRTNIANYSQPSNTDHIRNPDEDTEDDEEEKSEGDVLCDAFTFAPVSTADIKEEKTEFDELISVTSLTEDKVSVDCDPSLSSLSTQSQAPEDLDEKDKTLSGELFNQTEKLREHDTGHTSPETSFKCGECDKQFRKKTHLRKHQARHAAILLKCALCDKQYRDSRALRRHELRHAKRTVPVPCPICGISFKNSHGMEIHKFKHLGPRETPETESNFKCRFCGLILTSQAKKARHEFEVHDNNSHMCTYCGKKFNGSTAYEKHLTTHSNLRIPCGTCGKVFSHQRQLDRHQLNLHQADSEKRYQCSVTGCTRGFTKALSLESHINSHLGIKPYKCDLCEARFQNNSNQLAHLRKVHRKGS